MGNTTEQKAPSAEELATSAYDGPVGQTRQEAIHVTIPMGFLRSIKVYRGVNVATHPELREPALSGALHRFDGGEELAVPFVYHDPEARRFAMVLPEVLRHEELRRRGQLLLELADDVGHPIPPYVRQARVVIGIAGLATYLDEPEAERNRPVGGPRRDPPGDFKHLERDGDLSAREDHVARLEARARAFGEALERREQDLSVRERDLELSFTALGSADDLSVEEDIEDITGFEPLKMERTAFTKMGDDREAELLAEDVEEIVDEDDMEEIQEVEASSVSSDSPFSADEDDVELVEDSLEDVDVITSVAAADIMPPVRPPPEFLRMREMELAATYADDGLWLFARLDEGHEQAFIGTGDLLVQLSTVDAYPVILLTLVDYEDPARPYVRRGAFDSRNDRHRAILDALKEKFEATVAIFDPSGRFQRTLDVVAPREANMEHALRRADEATVTTPGDVPLVLERALAAPPPFKPTLNPFTDFPNLSSATDVLGALEELTKWMPAAKRDELLLRMSVPEDRVHEGIRRVLDKALQFGLGIGGELVRHAIEMGMATDESDLVRASLRRFAEVGEDTDLLVEDRAHNWERLMEAAEEFGVEVEDGLHEAAWAAIRAAGGHADVEVGDVSRLPELSAPALAALLQHPKLRADAASELCARAEVDSIEPVYETVRRMPRAHVLRVAPRVLLYGDAAGGALIDGLSARKTFVRQASALLLSELQLRRAITPLVNLLRDEPSDVWREISRVVGKFGMGAYRALIRVLKDGDMDRDRAILTLAHLANNGCSGSIEELAARREEPLAALAQEALGQRERALEASQQAQASPESAGEEPILAFTRRFYAELGHISDPPVPRGT